MNLFKEQAVRDHEAAAGAIPVIDYGPYFAGEIGALDRLAGELAHACGNIGFFYALNHGVPDDVIERAFLPPRRGLATTLGRHCYWNDCSAVSLRIGFELAAA